MYPGPSLQWPRSFQPDTGSLSTDILGPSFYMPPVG